MNYYSADNAEFLIQLSHAHSWQDHSSSKACCRQIRIDNYSAEFFAAFKREDLADACYFVAAVMEACER